LQLLGRPLSFGRLLDVLLLPVLFVIVKWLDIAGVRLGESTKQ
jgi:hypothetical protein